MLTFVTTRASYTANNIIFYYKMRTLVSILLYTILTIQRLLTIQYISLQNIQLLRLLTIRVTCTSNFIYSATWKSKQTNIKLMSYSKSRKKIDYANLGKT